MENLPGILQKHGAWLRDKDAGERADLSGADLLGADLRGADLTGAILRNADLNGANLSGANLRDADLKDANLLCADLHGAVLYDANLHGASLHGANLRCARLHYANLRGANLSGANLSGASLRGTDLRGVNLSGAEMGEVSSLWGTVGNMREVKTVQCGTWPVTYTADLMQIGCQLHSLDEWWTFTDDEISRMDADALTWWRKWKPLLESIIEASPADTPADPSEDESA